MTRTLNPPDGTDAHGVLPVATKLFAVSSNNINDINTMHTANHHQQPKKRNKKDTKNTNKLFDRENVRIGVIGSGLAGLSAALAILRAARYRSSATASIATNACADKHTNSFNDNNNDSKGNNHGCMTERKGRETPNMNISIQIIIYERDTQISDRKEGYGMTITYNPDGPLAKLELLEEVAQKDCPSRSHYLLDGQGNVKGYFGNAFYSEDNILIATTTDNDNGDAITESNESLSVKPLTTNTDEKSAATTTTTEIQVARGAGQRGNIRIPRSELRSILFNALMKEAGEIAAMNAAQSTDYHPLTATKNSNEGDDGECNKGDTNSTICNSGSNGKAGCADASGVDNGVNNNQEVCTIQWNKRLESYIDRPMESKLNSIFGNDSSNASKQMHGSQKNQQPNRSVLLNFYDGTTDQVDLLIGADGVNSVVAHQYLSRVLPACSNKKKEKEGQPLKATTNEERKSANSPVDDTTTNNATTSPSSPTSTGMSSAATPHYLGIFIILGITNTFHPLIDERGFYTLDGTHRLFIMPFEGSRIEDARIAAAAKAAAAAHGENKTDGESDGINTAIASSKNVENHPPKRRRTMWQLSFPVLDRKEAQRMSVLPPKELQKEVMRRCGLWHEPFPQMVTETPLNTIWGTGLLDRDPQLFLQHRQSIEIHGRIPSHIILIGDAAHAMSPFKGQGANQALADGPLLAKWLSKSKLDSAVRGFMTEMAQRSGVKVRASREAALQLHSKNCWEWMATCGITAFHGVQEQHVPKLLETLKTRGVGAALGSELDNTIDGVIKEMNIADAMQPPGSLNEKISTKEMTNLQSQALQYASTANTHQLRLLSRKSNLIIPAAKDPNQHQRTCLHLAARNGHLDTCRWLLSEVNASCHLLDKDGKTALDLAEECGHTDVVGLLKSWLDYSKPSSKQNANNQSVDQPVQDIYRLVEKQLRGIRNKNQLCTLLRNNRNGVSSAMTSGTQITHIIGCPLDEADDERDVDLIKALAEEHGAVLLRNFIPREVDQLALGALALRPLKLEYDDTLNYMYPCGIEKECNPLESLANKSSMGMARRKMEEIKSFMHISADSSVVVQTNFGPQSLLYSQSPAASVVATPQSIQDTSSSDNPTKKRKIDFFPLSKLRYLNLGEWNYNWGDRKYEKVSGAMKLSESLVALAQRAYSIAKQRTNILEIIPPIPFNMAICNLYHLQRPSDRLGGHQDNVESNLSLPLVTISLGAPGIFLLGGTSRGVMPTAILLRAGDCMVLGGKSRGYFHGVPTILEHECEEPINKNESFETVFPEINGDGSFNEGAAVDCNKERNDVIPTKKECLFVKAFLSTLRMNLSIREV